MEELPQLEDNKEVHGFEKNNGILQMVKYGNLMSAGLLVVVVTALYWNLPVWDHATYRSQYFREELLREQSRQSHLQFQGSGQIGHGGGVLN